MAGGGKDVAAREGLEGWGGVGWGGVEGQALTGGFQMSWWILSGAN